MAAEWAGAGGRSQGPKSEIARGDYLKNERENARHQGRRGPAFRGNLAVFGSPERTKKTTTVFAAIRQKGER